MNLIKWIALGVLAAMVLLFMFFPVVAWIIIGLLLLVILLVLFVPVGADVAYVDECLDGFLEEYRRRRCSRDRRARRGSLRAAPCAPCA